MITSSTRLAGTSVALPGPSEVAAYLRQAGWSPQGAPERWAVFTKRLEGDIVEVEVPQRSAAPDYGRALRLLLDDLARLEDRSNDAVLRDVRATSLDIVRLRVEGAITRRGSIPVEAGRRFYGATRDLLLAAACSALAPRAVHPKRKPDQAMRVLERVCFGQTEHGSFVLTLETPVPPGFATSEQSLEAEGEPIERRTTVMLARGLIGVEAAAKESSTSGSLDPFRRREQSGVSANLCDAIAELIEATQADFLESTFSFASRRPLVHHVPRHIALGADVTPTLREASAQLRHAATYPDTEITGPVVALDRRDGGPGGAVVIKASIDGRFRSVRVELTQADYLLAIEAHRERAMLSLVGELARDKAVKVLHHARHVRLLPND